MGETFYSLNSLNPWTYRNIYQILSLFLFYLLFVFCSKGVDGDDDIVLYMERNESLDITHLWINNIGGFKFTGTRMELLQFWIHLTFDIRTLIIQWREPFVEYLFRNRAVSSTTTTFSFFNKNC